MSGYYQGGWIAGCLGFFISILAVVGQPAQPSLERPSVADWWRRSTLEFIENEGGVDLSLNRHEDHVGEHVLWLTVREITAKAGEDFRTVPESVLFSAGEEQISLSLQLIDNTEIDGERWFDLEISSADGVSGVTTIRIQDNERALVLDPTYSVENSRVVPLAKTNEGSILGGFQGGLVRMAANGQRDPNFRLEEYEVHPRNDAFNDITHVLVTPQDELVVAGFYEFFGGASLTMYSWIQRYQADGGLLPGASRSRLPVTYLSEILLQPDGNVLYAGSLENFQTGSSSTRIGRILGTGGGDRSFESSRPFRRDEGGISSLGIQSDGKILVGGNFREFDQVEASSLVRLQSSGLLDPDFESGLLPGSSVSDLFVLPDDRLIVVGHLIVGENDQRGLVRLDARGGIDWAFAGNDLDFDENPNSIQIDSERGWLYAQGPYRRIGTETRDGIARLSLASGQLDEWFVPLRAANVGWGGFSIVEPSGHLLTSAGRVFTDGLDRQVARFSNRQYAMDEAGKADQSLVVERLGTTGNPFTVTLETVSSGAAGKDFVGLPETIEFEPGVSQIEVGLQPLDNGQVNPTLSLDLTLLNERGEPQESFVPRARVLIEDNEIPNRLDPDFIADESRALLNFERLANGKILVASRVGSNRIQLLNNDGSVDENFDARKLFPRPAQVSVIRAQTDEWVLAGGWADDERGVRRAMMTRFHHQTGQIDETFVVPRLLNSRQASGDVKTIALQKVDSEEKILIGGTIRGAGRRDGLMRLNSDGSFDLDFGGTRGFQARSGTMQIHVLTVTETGSILVGGFFDSVDDVVSPGLALLQPDGQPSTAFKSPFVQNEQVFSAAVDNEGRIVVGARTNFSRGVVLRLLPDGSRDAGFVPVRADGTIWSLAQDNDGRIYVIGDFSVLNEQLFPSLGRLLPDGSLDFSLIPTARSTRNLRKGEWDAGGLYLMTSSRSQFDQQYVEGLFRVLPETNPIGNRVIFDRIAGVRTWTEGEEHSLVEFKLLRLGNSDSALPNPVTLELDGAVSGEDFEMSAPLAEFAPLEVATTFAVNVLDDGHLEGSESVTFRVSDSPSRSLQDHSTLTIFDNEEPRLLDYAFSTRIGPDQAPSVVHSFSDGRLLLAGIKEYDGEVVNGLARIHADGSPDESFQLEGTLDGAVLSVLVEEDGLWLGGNFRLTSADGEVWQNLTRVGLDGELLSESSSIPEIDRAVRVITKDPSGSIYLGGDFGRVGTERRRHVAKLLPSGELDETFVGPSNLDGSVRALGVQSGGRLVVGSNYLRMGNVDLGSLIRLLPDGVHDESFVPNVGGLVSDIITLRDDALIITGSIHQVGGETRSGIAKLLSDGQLDPSFGLRFVSGAVQSIVRDGDQLVLGGSIQVGPGEPNVGLIWIEEDGTVVRRVPEQGRISQFGLNQVVIGEDGMPIIVSSSNSQQGTRTSHLIRLDLSQTTQTMVNLIEAGSGVAGSRVSIHEPNATIDLTLQRIGDLSDSSVVRLRLVASSPEAEGNVSLMTEQVEFAPLERFKTFQLQAIDDELPESTGWIEIEVESLSDDTAIGNNSLIVEVVDNDREGSLDTTFSPQIERMDYYGFGFSSGRRGSGGFGESFVDADVWAVEVQNDQQILVAGDFSRIDNVEIEGLARLYPNGDLDLDYRPGFRRSAVERMALQSDDRLLIVNQGEGEERLYRLDPAGERDPSFHGLSIASRGQIRDLLVLPDDRIVIWGDLRGWPELGQEHISVLLPDGELDPQFQLGDGPNREVLSVQFQAPSQLVIGGRFTRFGVQSIRSLVRVGLDGKIDETFARFGTPNRLVEQIYPLGNGWLQVRGDFGRVGEFAQSNVATLSREGLLLDLSNQLPAYNRIIPLAGGDSYSVGEFDLFGKRDVIRLNAAGRMDERFNAGNGLNGTVRDVALKADGSLLLAGRFNSYDNVAVGSLFQVNGRRVIRIESISRIDDNRTEVVASARQGEAYVLEFSTDLERWESRDRRTAEGGQLTLRDQNSGTNGFYRVRQE